MAESESGPSVEGPAVEADGGSGAEAAPAAAPVPPYGLPIHEAIASGDLQRMKAVAEGARKALYAVEFDRVPADRVHEVKDALRSLEAAITRLESGGKPNY